MQRVTNCILIHNDHILLIKKPRRGWYSIPGGKMERGETIKQSAVREFYEETNLHIQDPSLMGVFTISMHNDHSFVRDWMMFTFVSHSFEGQLNEYCDEGDLEWISISHIDHIPMAEGDRDIFRHVLNRKNTVLYGAFSYTEEFVLLNSQLDPSNT